MTVWWAEAETGSAPRAAVVTAAAAPRTAARRVHMIWSIPEQGQSLKVAARLPMVRREVRVGARGHAHGGRLRRAGGGVLRLVRGRLGFRPRAGDRRRRCL